MSKEFSTYITNLSSYERSLDHLFPKVNDNIDDFLAKQIINPPKNTTLKENQAPVLQKSEDI